MGSGSWSLDEWGLSTSHKGEGVPYVALPNVTSPRWVVPYHWPLRNKSLNLYAPHNLLGRLAKIWLHFSGDPVWLTSGWLSELRTKLGRTLGGGPLHFAFYVGTPGAYQKLTIQAMWSSGEIAAYAKIAYQPLAKQRLQIEARHLAGPVVQSLAPLIPSVLDVSDWCDSLVLVISPGPTTSGPTRLSSMHMDFLAQLHERSVVTQRYDESALRNRISQLTTAMRGQFGETWRNRWDRAARYLERRLGGVWIPFSLAHGDFAPWNTRVTSEGRLYVFDWETANIATPLYDFFHFYAIQASLGRRRTLPHRALGLQLLSSLWPNGTSHFDDLYLCYLLDMCLAYAWARVQSPKGNDAVFNWLGDQLDLQPEDEL